MSIIDGFSFLRRLFFILLFCMGLSLKAQTQHYNFYNHSTDNGLVTNDYQKIFHDSYGFIWLASFDGLFRWDGYSIKKYTHQEKDSLSLNNNIVYSIFEDSQKRLWVGTIEGLNLYDASRDVFITMPVNAKHDKIPINAIMEDEQHNLWLGTSNGLCKYNANQRTGTWFLGQGDENIIFCMAKGAHNTIWAGTFNKGVVQFNTQTHAFRYVRNIPGQPASLPSNKIQSILVDKANRVWVGTEDRGIAILDEGGNVLHTYDNLSHNSQFMHSNTRCLYQDTKGNIWIGIGREVLCVVKAGSHSLQPEPVTTKAQNNGQDGILSITSITEDQFGNTWFASAGYGLFTTNERKNVFNNMLTNTHALPKLSTTVVTAFYEDAAHKIWIGTAGNGVALYDPLQGVLTTSPLYSAAAVNDVKGDRDGNIWIATWADGIKTYNPQTHQAHHFTHDPLTNYSLVNNDVKALLPTDSFVWIGTHGEGLAVYKKSEKRFIHYKNNKEFPFNMQAPAWVNHLYEDKQKRIWISTYSGLFMYNGKTLSHFAHTEKANSINSNSVNMVVEDHAGKLWIVTEQGLDQFDEPNAAFIHLNNQLSLPVSMKSIAVDAKGQLWMGTNEGLVTLDPITLKLQHYDKNDGLYDKTFFQKAALRASDGTLYFGGPKGFSAFNPAAILPVETPTYFYFSDLYVFGEQQRPGQAGSALQKILDDTDTLVLTQKQSFFSIGFAAINLYAPQKIKYSYRLEGYYDDWIDVVDERRISFAHLQPGTYTLQVRYTNVNGDWQAPAKSLLIKVLPYWWQTWWFKTLLCLFVLVAIAAIFYWRVSSVKKRNRILKEEVRRQTAQLQETNTSLMEQRDKISLQKEKLAASYAENVRQTDKILVQQQQISTQNQELEQAVAELEKSNQSKDYFFSILAHDLKNPVGALKELAGFMQTHAQKIDAATLQQYVGNMHQSASRVFDLLVNLLSWSMSQSRQMTLQPVDANMAELIHNNLQLLATQIRNKHIQIHVKIDEPAWFHADQQMMDVVVRNLLSNSVKFTDYNGEVHVHTFTNGTDLVLQVKDNGLGMTKEQMASLFEMNKTTIHPGTAGEKGTGLGLMIVHDFLAANHAHIAVESEPNKGSVFTVRIPAAQELPVATEVITTKDQRELAGEFWQTIPTEKFLKIKGKKILIVEDSKEIRDYLRLILSDVFEIFEAENGEQAYNMALEEMPSVIITDVLMPGMNGIQFCKEIKSHTATSHIPVIILTSQWEETMQASGYAAGAEAYLTKPVKQAVLLQVIFNFLQKQDQVYQRVRDQIYNDAPLPVDTMLSDVDQQFLNDLIQFIEANMANQELDAKQISKALLVSRTVLYNKVKSLTGQTVHEFIKAIRLRKSVQLLLSGNLSINQVAFEVGFNSHSYFDKCFHKQYGMGPKEYITRKKA